MKILIFALEKYPRHGGVDTYIRSITSALQQRGHTVDLLDYSQVELLPKNRISKIQEIWGLLEAKMGTRAPQAIIEYEKQKYALEELLKYIDVSQYDIIHSQNGITSYVASKIHPEIPLAGTIHGCFFSEAIYNGYAQNTIEAELFGRYDNYAVSCPSTVITVSSFLNENIPPIPDEKHKIIFSGVDTNVFKPKQRLNSRVRIATSGKLSYHKGYDILVQALIMLKKQGFEFEIEMFGDGPEASKLQSLAAESQLAVGFRGNIARAQLAQELPNFDIFVQPSRLDNFPFSVIEAMSCGCVPVCSRIAGMQNQVSHMTNGILYTPESVDELFEALKLLIEDAPLRQKLGKHARAEVINRFSLTKTGEKLEKAYQETISRHYAQSTAS